MRILYVTTSFPVYSETFLQREVRALIKAGVELKILSLHAGEAFFEGHPVCQFKKRELFKLIYLLPVVVWRKRGLAGEIVRGLFGHRPVFSLSLLENLLGLGAAVVMEKRIREFSPDIVHCVWAGGPAAFGLVAEALIGVRFSTGAHAYDIFEHGGDCLLGMKLRRAALVHVSTRVAKDRIRNLCDEGKVKLIRRGLNTLPHCREPRESCDTLQILCVARLVEKKGFPYQLEIYRRLKQAGIRFRVEIIGEGPLQVEIDQKIGQFGLREEVELVGRVSEEEVLQRLQHADLLFHTGVVAASGDRDGLPNVVPEAMASGVVVIGSPVSGVVEAIEDEVSGYLCPPWEPEKWVRRCSELKADAALRRRLASAARKWVELEFVADKNTGDLLECLEVARGGSRGLD